MLNHDDDPQHRQTRTISCHFSQKNIKEFISMKNIKHITLASVVLLGLGVGTAVTVPTTNIMEPTTVQAAAMVPYKVQPVDADTGENIGDPISLTGEVNSIPTDFPKVDGHTVVPDQKVAIKPGLKFKIKYTRNATAVTINYVTATGTELGSETQNIKYGDKGNISLKNDLGDQYTLKTIEVGDNKIGLQANADNTAVTYDNTDENNGIATIKVIYDEAATLTINSLDENGNTLTDPKTIDGQTVGTNYEGKLDKQIKVGDKTYTLQSWANADDGNINGNSDVLAITLNKAATMINATYKADESTTTPTDPDQNADYYLPGVYANSSAGIALDANHYTIVSAGAGVGLLGATAYNSVQFTGILGSAWKVGTRVYVGPFGVWVIAGITPDKKVVVTPLSADASASAAVAGIDSALAAGATANASAFEGAGAAAGAGITTPTDTKEAVVGVGNEADNVNEAVNDEDTNIISNITNGTIKAVNGIVGGIANTVNKVINWIF